MSSIIPFNENHEAPGIRYFKKHIQQDNSYVTYFDWIELNGGYLDGIWRDNWPLSVIKFKNEEDAVAFKLKYMA